MEKPGSDYYNDDPVFYCSNCLSLSIRDVDSDGYCDSCGSTKIESTDIDTWESMYRERYNCSFIERKIINKDERSKQVEF